MNEQGNRAVTALPAETRGRLMEATVACLKEHGLRGTTSRRIAAAAGVNLAGITYHFGSKDELVSQALIEAIRSLIQPAIDILREQSDPILRMIGAIQALQTSFEQGRSLLPVYMAALVEAPRDGALGTAAGDLFRELRGFLAEQIRGLKDNGFLPGWVDPIPMATALIALGDGIAVRMVATPEAVDHHAVAAQVIQLLLSAAPRDP